MLLPIRTKEVAFAKLENEQFVEIDKRQHDFRIRRRWFHNRNCCTFSTFFPEMLPPGEAYRILTIGVFEGAAEVWIMQNICTNPDARVVSIDPWLKTGKLDQEYMNQCHKNAQHNLSPWKGRIQLHRGLSQSVLTDALEQGSLHGIKPGEFDMALIDGDHTSDAVYQDATLCLQWVKPGGWLVFDDVRNRVWKDDHVAQALERWLPVYEDQVEFAWAHRYMDCYKKVK